MEHTYSGPPSAHFSLPFYRGQKFELLSPGELEDLVSHCLYCDKQMFTPESRINHLKSDHYEEYKRDITANYMEVLRAHKTGKQLELNPIQQEAYILATLEKATFNCFSPLDTIEVDVMNGQEISPSFFSKLLNMVNIKNPNFSKLVRVLTRSCTLMHLNCPEEITGFFQSEVFFRQYIQLNMVIDEIWVLRKEEPALLEDWKIKHKLIFKFRKTLQGFLKKRFGNYWVNDLKERAEMKRKPVGN